METNEVSQEEDDNQSSQPQQQQQQLEEEEKEEEDKEEELPTISPCTLVSDSGSRLFYKWLSQQPNMLQQNWLHHFTHNHLHSLVISISHFFFNFPKLAKSPYYRLDILAKFCHFCNVLKALNNSYQ